MPPNPDFTQPGSMLPIKFLTRFTLGATLFMLIFGPRLFGMLYFDTISLTSVAVIGYVLLHQRLGAKAMMEGRIFYALPLFLVIYSLLISLVRGSGDYFYPQKFIRATLNIAAVVALYRVYVMHAGGDARRLILKHMVIAISVHALIMCLQYTVGPFRDMIYALTGDELRKADRVSGLTISYNTLTWVQSAGFLMINVVRRQVLGLSFPAWLACNAVITPSLFISGRTGAILALAILAVWLTFSMLAIGRFARLVGAAVAILAVVFMGKFFLPPDVMERFSTSTFSKFTEMFEAVTSGDLLTESHGGRTFNHMMQHMWFLPTTLGDTLWGNGNSGRGESYIPSDIGYVLDIFGIGMAGMFIELIFYAFVMRDMARAYRVDIGVGFVSIAFGLGVLLLNVKEQLLFTRHALTVTMVFACLARNVLAAPGQLFRLRPLLVGRHGPAKRVLKPLSPKVRPEAGK